MNKGNYKDRKDFDDEDYQPRKKRGRRHEPIVMAEEVQSVSKSTERRISYQQKPSYSSKENNSFKKSRSLRVGDLVYFHAFIDKERKISVLCKGHILRRPTEYSHVYKVIISAVSNVIHPVKQGAILNSKALLGKKIPKDSSQVSLDMGILAETFSKEAIQWNELDPISKNKMNKILKNKTTNSQQNSFKRGIQGR